MKRQNRVDNPITDRLTKKLISRLDKICKTFGPIVDKNTTLCFIFAQQEVNLNFDYPIILPEALESGQFFHTMTLNKYI